MLDRNDCKSDAIATEIVSMLFLVYMHAMHLVKQTIVKISVWL